MWRVSVIWVLCFACVWAGLPGEDSISQNYEACHSNTHGMTANPNNKRSVPKVDEPSLDRARRQAESCDSTLRYRSVDGTCNNLNNPSWGSNGQNFLRLLDPVYDDGKPYVMTVSREDS
ncbi:hypothetical protein V1264_014655 [Littorina saxatilis]|uniref:Uncharacterized protein n=1 Tax=Littorina saxatilis TaxID=31220 RepID=A0AAN9BTF8_9CAEN